MSGHLARYAASSTFEEHPKTIIVRAQCSGLNTFLGAGVSAFLGAGLSAFLGAAAFGASERNGRNTH